MVNLWTEQYRPATVDDAILPKGVRKTLKGVLDTGDIPNMIFHGGPGIGKTTAALALVSELNGSAIVINGSDESGIDALRNKVRNFASTTSLTGGQKVVIYDEADALTAATQAALRGFIEEFASTCRFIFTCNYPQKLIAPLQDRCVSVDFTVPASELEALQAKMFLRLKAILEENNVEYDDKVLAAFVRGYGSRWRKMIGDLNSYAKSGKIDVGVLSSLKSEDFSVLINALREKNFKDMQKWVVDNHDLANTQLVRKFYDQMRAIVKPECIPGLVMILNSWQVNAAVVADPEINTVAHLTEIMRSVEFKDG